VKRIRIMNDFEYYRPKDLKETLEILEWRKGEVALLSGGTNLLVDWRLGKIQPKILLDISRLKELDFIEDRDGFIWIGSGTRMKEIENSPIIKTFANFLSIAASQMGSPQIRNRASIGGNIISASPAADTLTPLLALEAVLRLKSIKGEREVPLEFFLKGPKITDIHTDEVLIDIRFAKSNSKGIGRFLKFGRRNALAISVINIAILLFLKEGEGKIENVRIALGAVAPKAIRAKEVERFLIGKYLDDKVIQQASKIASEECDPISDIRATAENRRLMVEVWLGKILSDLANLDLSKRKV
jgi:carbon-monoxide dehydrogenase medium subunit